ncbi:MAG TPA: aminotransferase [Xanthomarina gelatinilytica]|nr:aminotransferase [Xanthomarina gelatinilytica]
MILRSSRGNRMEYLELEKEYARHLNIEDVVSVNTGTAALHVALEALQMPQGTRVIIPEFTMYASALAAHYARLTPIFVDCDDDLLIDLEKLEDNIDRNTGAIMITHIYGRIVNMDKVMSIAKKHGLRVIEDACEAQGAKFGTTPVGTFDIGCFSLYRNKIICAEEGGIVASKDAQFLERVRDMKSMSFGASHDYYHQQIGFNYRMTNSQASLALRSLENHSSNIKRRENIKDFFNDHFKSEFQMPDNRDVVWVYDMRHPRADAVVKHLKAAGIAARHSFKPMSMMPLFEKGTDITQLKAYKKSTEVFYLHIDPRWELGKLINIVEKVNPILENM